MSYCRLQGSDRVLLDVGVRRQADAAELFVSLALVILASVGIVSLELKLCSLGVLEGTNFPSSIAACITSVGRTVDKLLFGVLVELAVDDEVVGFNCSDCSEGPA